MSKEEYYGFAENTCPFMLMSKERPCKKSLFKRLDGTKSAYCVVHAYKDSPGIKYAACPYEPLNSMPEHLIA